MSVNSAQTGITFAGAVSTIADLPTTAVVGEMRMVLANGAMYMFNGTAWMQAVAGTDWHLFLDDERDPADAQFDTWNNVKVARCTEEAQRLVELHGLPTQMSLDHDLGGDDTGFKFLWWLINGHIDEHWHLGKLDYVQVHSRNPVGVDKLCQLWNGFAVEFQILNPSGKPRAARIVPARKKHDN